MSNTYASPQLFYSILPPHLFKVKRVNARLHEDLALARQPPLTRRPGPPLLLLGVHQPAAQSRRGRCWWEAATSRLGHRLWRGLGLSLGAGAGSGAGSDLEWAQDRARARARAVQRTCPAQA